MLELCIQKYGNYLLFPRECCIVDDSIFDFFHFFFGIEMGTNYYYYFALLNARYVRF